MDSYAKVGRGGAGNYYSQQEVQEAAARLKVSEPIPSSNPFLNACRTLKPNQHKATLRAKLTQRHQDRMPMQVEAVRATSYLQLLFPLLA